MGGIGAPPTETGPDNLFQNRCHLFSLCFLLAICLRPGTFNEPNSTHLMKKSFLLTTTLIALGLAPTFAQPGARGGGPSPNFGGAMSKLFGANQTFSTTMEFQMPGPDGDTVTMSGQMNFDTGKSRFEMNMSEMRGSKMPPSALTQMKAMGMDTVISISRPDLNLVYVVYPGLNSYLQRPQPASSDSVNPDDYKAEFTELGKETVDGHDCVKNKVIVTDKAGTKHESTVWNATDLKNFPVKIETTEQGKSATMLFKSVSFNKPASSLFEAPAGLTKFDNMQALQSEVMKKMTGGMGAPPAQH